MRILEISCQFSKNLFWYTSATCEPHTGQSQFKIPIHTARYTHRIRVTCLSRRACPAQKISRSVSSLPFTKKNGQLTALSHDLSFISLISAPAFLLVRQYRRRRARQWQRNANSSPAKRPSDPVMTTAPMFSSASIRRSTSFSSAMSAALSPLSAFGRLSVTSAT